MDLVFGILNVVFGILFALIGFKIYNPYKGKNQFEKEQERYSKYGAFFKFGGIELCYGDHWIVVTSI